MDRNIHFSSEHEKTVCEKIISVLQTTSPFRIVRFTSQLNREDVAKLTTPPNVSLMTRTPVVDRCARVSKQSLAPVDNKKASDGADVAIATSLTLMTPTPLRDRCPRVPKQSVVAPADNKQESGAVPVIFKQSGDHSNGSSGKSSPKVFASPKINQPSTQVVSPNNIDQGEPKASIGISQGKVTVLPIQGYENRVPTISHAGQKSSVVESVNGMFTEYIDRAGRIIRAPTAVGIREPSMTQDSFNDRVSDFINRGKHKFHNAPSFAEASFRKHLNDKY